MTSQTQAKVSDSILAKIQKTYMKSKEEHNPSENERAVCLEKVYQMLAQHNLTLTDIEGPSVENEVGEEVLDNFQLEPWGQTLISSVCKLYYTEWFMAGRRRPSGSVKYTPTIVGTPGNIAATISMVRFLANSIRTEQGKLRFADELSKRSFKLGAVSSIAKRVQELLLSELPTAQTTNFSEANPAVPGTQLVALRSKLIVANEEYNAKAHPNLQKRTARPLEINVNSYAQGVAFGSTVSLNRQLK